MRYYVVSQGMNEPLIDFPARDDMAALGKAQNLRGGYEYLIRLTRGGKPLYTVIDKRCR